MFNNSLLRVASARHGPATAAAWIQRHVRDRYVQKASLENYRSRAAYKLQQLDDEFCFLRRGYSVVDLGCFAGGWSQVALERT